VAVHWLAEAAVNSEADVATLLPTGELMPGTAAGGRFVALAEELLGELREGASVADREGEFPREGFAALQASGIVAAFVPAALGGLGLDSIADWAAGLERLGRADASLAIALNMHLAVTRGMAGAWQRAGSADDAPSAQLLKAIVAGRMVFCATATEPGTDFLRPATEAVRDGDEYVINGRKIFVTLSPVANLCMMNLKVATPDGDRMAFATVPTDAPGFQLQDDWDALGMRASGSQSLVLADCRVPAGSVQLTGEWGRWNPGVLMGRTLNNVTLLGVFLGLAERARELAVAAATAQTKPKHGGAIAGAAGVQHRLGEIDIELAAARAVLGDTTRRFDAFLAKLPAEGPDLAQAHACMRDYQTAKWVVNQNAIRIVSYAMDVAGGGSFMARNELSRLYRDVRAGPFMQPFSPTEAREYIGAVAVGRPPAG
jgi:alkylation response protein AidB-like acyl-CoA dehydrogenase